MVSDRRAVMRVNIYAEEMTNRVEIVTKTTEEGTFTGVRFYLELPCTVPNENPEYSGLKTRNVSGPFIHRAGDDDSAAITFWGKGDAKKVFQLAIELLDAHHAAKQS